MTTPFGDSGGSSNRGPGRASRSSDKLGDLRLALPSNSSPRTSQTNARREEMSQLMGSQDTATFSFLMRQLSGRSDDHSTGDRSRRSYADNLFSFEALMDAVGVSDTESSTSGSSRTDEPQNIELFQLRTVSRTPSRISTRSKSGRKSSRLHKIDENGKQSTSHKPGTLSRSDPSFTYRASKKASRRTSKDDLEVSRRSQSRSASEVNRQLRRSKSICHSTESSFHPRHDPRDPSLHDRKSRSKSKRKKESSGKSRPRSSSKTSNPAPPVKERDIRLSQIPTPPVETTPRHLVATMLRPSCLDLDAVLNRPPPVVPVQEVRRSKSATRGNRKSDRPKKKRSSSASPRARHDNVEKSRSRHRKSKA